MTIKEVKNYIDKGFDLRWGNDAYRIIKTPKLGEYQVICDLNNHCFGLCSDDERFINIDLNLVYIKK